MEKEKIIELLNGLYESTEDKVIDVYYVLYSENSIECGFIFQGVSHKITEFTLPNNDINYETIKWAPHIGPERFNDIADMILSKPEL